MPDDWQDPAGEHAGSEVDPHARSSGTDAGSRERETPPPAPQSAGETSGAETAPTTAPVPAPAPASNPVGPEEATLRARLAEHALRHEPQPGRWQQPAQWPRPAAPPHAPWPPQGMWHRPVHRQGAWPESAMWPRQDTWRGPAQQPGPWPPQAAWAPQASQPFQTPWQPAAGQWQRPFAPAWPGPMPGQWQWPGAAPAWPAPGYGAIPPTWFPSPMSWALGSVPWGFANPPAVAPVLEPPGRFHAPIPGRRPTSLSGRASPRLHAFGLIAGLPGIAALLLILIGLGAGFRLPGGAIPRWLILEAACVIAAAGMVAWATAQGRQRRADGWRDYAGPSPFLMIGALLAIVTAFQIPLEAALDSAQVDINSGLATALLVGMFLATYLTLVHFLVVRPGALTWHDIARPGRLAPSADDWATGDPIPGWSRRAGETVAVWRSRISGGRLGDLLMPVAMVLPLIIASNLLSAGMLLVLGLKASDISTPGSSGPLSDFDRILLFVAVAILAPIGEEIFFRGFATNAWGRSLGRASTIVRASLFFAFIHVMNTSTPDLAMFWRVALFNFGARIPVAFVLTWLYMRRRSILASGMLHAGYNGLITLLSLA